MLRVAFDIGGVLSKYPGRFGELVRILIESDHAEVHVITDMHDHAEVVRTLAENGFGAILPERVHCADYARYGEMCKAVLLKSLSIDMFIDDSAGYVQWDSCLGPAPIRLLLAPDGFRPYWHEGWKVAGDHEFGRRVTSPASLMHPQQQKEGHPHG